MVEFLNEMSHELRTPLNSVIGFAQLVQEKGRELDEAKRERYVANILRSGGHLLNLINDINDALDLAKVRAGRMEFQPTELDFDTLVLDEIQSLEAVASAAGVRIVRPSERVGRVTADRRSVHQVLLNLLSNAIKFVGPGGRVEVATASRGDDVLRAWPTPGPESQPRTRNGSSARSSRLRAGFRTRAPASA